MKSLYNELEKDVRYIEGLKACFNCGICTAICPAAEVSDYDPRQVVNIVQQKDEVDNEMYPEQGPIWEWLRKNRESMLPYEPDLIIANCPECTFFLDRWQYVIAEMEGKTYRENGEFLKSPEMPKVLKCC